MSISWVRAKAFPRSARRALRLTRHRAQDQRPVTRRCPRRLRCPHRLRAAWAVANENPDDDYAVGPPDEIADCIARLATLGVRARASQQPVHKEGALTCGAPQAVSYEAGPSGARWSSSPHTASRMRSTSAGSSSRTGRRSTSIPIGSQPPPGPRRGPRSSFAPWLGAPTTSAHFQSCSARVGRAPQESPAP